MLGKTSSLNCSKTDVIVFPSLQRAFHLLTFMLQRLTLYKPKFKSASLKLNPLPDINNLRRYVLVHEQNELAKVTVSACLQEASFPWKARSFLAFSFPHNFCPNIIWMPYCLKVFFKVIYHSAAL